MIMLNLFITHISRFFPFFGVFLWDFPKKKNEKKKRKGINV